MDFRVFDKQYQNRLYFVGDLETQFRNREAVVPPAVAYRMSRHDKGFSFVIEDKTVPFNPDSWKKDRRLIWSCNVSSANGYGMVAENTVKSLLALGVNVEVSGSVSGSLISGGEYVDPQVVKAIKNVIEPDCLEIQHCQPPSLNTSIVERIWIYTMFETSHTPKSWIKKLNEVDHVLVPASWLVESWQEQGLKRPISVYGHGVDPSFYHYLDRPKREVFTFLHYAQLSIRKGTELVYKAFVDEFQGKDDVKLILKTTYPMYPVPYGTKNVEYINATYSKEQMTDLLKRSDCFVFPTRGEGFGLPALEAMACGLPTIVTGWSGPADYASPENTLILSYSMTRSPEFDGIYKDFWEPGENSGEWAEPSYEDLRAKMRWCYEHREEAQTMGKKAAERIAKDWTWEAQAGGLVGLLNRYI